MPSIRWMPPARTNCDKQMCEFVRWTVFMYVNLMTIRYFHLYVNVPYIYGQSGICMSMYGYRYRYSYHWYLVQ